MSFDMNYKRRGGLTYSSIGQKGTQTRIIALGSPELFKLREELGTANLYEPKPEVTLKEILDRLDEPDQSET